MTARRLWIPLVVAAAALAACATRGVRPHEYLLTSTAAASDAEALDLRLGVGPVGVPAYLDRPNLVRRVSDNELAVHDLHRWGEPLDAGVARVVAEDLAALLPAHQVETYPWRSLPRLDYRVTMEIEHFEHGPDGNVVLAVRWFVGEGRNGRIRRAVSSRYEVATRGDAPADSVAAMSEALARLSDEIAGTLRGYRRS